MANYLNPDHKAFERRLKSGRLVDKSAILHELNDCVNDEDRKFVCISRPRRFGKSVTAGMLCAYYGQGDSAELFAPLQIAQDESYRTHLNQYHVIFINMNDEFDEADHRVEKLKENLTADIGAELQELYPDLNLTPDKTLRKKLLSIYAKTKDQFVVIIDEWDCVMREKAPDADIKAYLDFLEGLFKGKSYIALAYMTGILPIKKYGKHSAINMFKEYEVTNPGVFAPYLGFTEDEVSSLCVHNDISFEMMKQWYDGYTIGRAEHIFNPNSVVNALVDREFRSYWTRTETWEALAVYLELDQLGLKETVVELLAGKRVLADLSGFQNDMTTFQNRDDVLALLTHLGYLTAQVPSDRNPDDETQDNILSLTIPNREVRGEFRKVIGRSKTYASTAAAIALSRELLNALLEGDAAKVAAGVAKAHEEHASILRYNDENSLSCVLSLAFYSARDRYTLIRELPTGKGFADLVFIPKPGADAPALLIELKYDHSVESALTQIKSQHYPQALEAYRGNLILAGISYDKDSKEHSCVIERA